MTCVRAAGRRHAVVCVSAALLTRVFATLLTCVCECDAVEVSVCGRYMLTRGSSKRHTMATPEDAAGLSTVCGSPMVTATTRTATTSLHIPPHHHILHLSTPYFIPLHTPHHYRIPRHSTYEITTIAQKTTLKSQISMIVKIVLKY